jgi:hypothetical protein
MKETFILIEWLLFFTFIFICIIAIIKTQDKDENE